MATATRLVALASAAIGLALQAWLGSHEWPLLAPLAAGAFLLCGALVRAIPSMGWWPLLVVAYIYPALFLATRGTFVPAYNVIWLAGLFGGIVASAPRLRWHLPAAWQLPLALWALSVALVWPIVAAREMNFGWAAIGEYSLANSGLGGPPPVVLVSMLLPVLTLLLGILWFDAMFARFGAGQTAEFRRQIVLPLAVSLTLGSVLAIYQWTVDIEFLSAHQWPYYGRAAGGLLDGNAFGAVLGLWSGAALSLALTSGPLGFAGLSVMSLLFWVGVWATGSRMALLAALVGLAFVIVAGFRGRRQGSNAGKLIAVSLAVAVVAGALVSLGRFGAHERHGMDPITRVAASLPDLNRDSLTKFAEFELWNRFGPFGTASVAMIASSPIVGVAPGTFEVLYPDYAYVVTEGATRSHFDNAQSWYRHQLAELGVLGSLGWMTWLVTFGVFVWRASPSREGLAQATGVKAALIALALICLVSMPTRNMFVALTFWVFAFWLVSATSAPADTGRLAQLARRRGAWVGVWALALAFAAGTAWVAHSQLRPPHRALMADWDYVNGISRLATTPDGPRRFAREHGIAVFPAASGFLKLVFSLPHADAETSPVRVKIFERNTQVANLLVGDRNDHELYVRVPDGQDRFMLQTRVSREVPASGDAPARGLILHDWVFVPEAPPGAMIAGAPAASR